MKTNIWAVVLLISTLSCANGNYEIIEEFNKNPQKQSKTISMDTSPEDLKRFREYSDFQFGKIYLVNTSNNKKIKFTVQKTSIKYSSFYVPFDKKSVYDLVQKDVENAIFCDGNKNEITEQITLYPGEKQFLGRKYEFENLVLTDSVFMVSNNSNTKNTCNCVFLGTPGNSLASNEIDYEEYLELEKKAKSNGVNKFYNPTIYKFNVLGYIELSE